MRKGQSSVYALNHPCYNLAMADYLEGLNENQRKAVITESNYVRVIAGAGSGKTRVLTTRVVYLVDALKVAAQRIVAITFTNKAAKEMKTRVEKMLINSEGTPHISTIHSLCVTILRQDITYLAYPRNFTIIDEEDQKAILKEGYRKYDIDQKALKYRSVLDYISTYKCADLSPEEAKDRAGYFGNEKLKALLYEYYDDRQKQLMALDFDDLLLFVKNLFYRFPEVLAKWQNKFQVILVDEFQDIDQVQYAIIRALVGNNNALYAVGDPDQTIYTWRGADVSIIVSRLPKDYPGLETITLTLNYRSSASILEAANRVIANNRNRYPKDLVAINQDVHEITYYCASDEENEGMWIASTIKELVVRKKLKYEDTAILYRANYVSRAIEKALINMHIPYLIYGGVSFYNRQEIKDMLSYLRLLITEDDLAFKRIVNVPRRKIGDKTLDKIEEKAQAENISMFKVISEYPEMFSHSTADKLQEFVRLIRELHIIMNEENLLKLAESVFINSGYKEMLLHNDEHERLENVKELINDIEDFTESNPEAGLDLYLQEISLYTDREAKDIGESVKLMTIHGAKGLEFDTVFVAALSEDVFPSARSLQDGIIGLEEERRLAYVAYTRAKKQLYLSDCQGHSYVLDKARTTSRFVEEIGRENLRLLGNFDYRYWNVAKKSVDIPIEKIPEVKNNIKWKVGDIVEHETFQRGVIVKIIDDTLEIAFNYPYKIKKIKKDFGGMRKA